MVGSDKTAVSQTGRQIKPTSNFSSTKNFNLKNLNFLSRVPKNNLPHNGGNTLLRVSAIPTIIESKRRLSDGASIHLSKRPRQYFENSPEIPYDNQHDHILIQSFKVGTGGSTTCSKGFILDIDYDPWVIFHSDQLNGFFKKLPKWEHRLIETSGSQYFNISNKGTTFSFSVSQGALDQAVNILRSKGYHIRNTSLDEDSKDVNDEIDLLIPGSSNGYIKPETSILQKINPYVPSPSSLSIGGIGNGDGIKSRKLRRQTDIPPDIRHSIPVSNPLKTKINIKSSNHDRIPLESFQETETSEKEHHKAKRQNQNVGFESFSNLDKINVVSSNSSTTTITAIPTKLGSREDIHKYDGYDLNFDKTFNYVFDDGKTMAISPSDISRLNETQFLNDTIISFFLKVFEQEHPELKNKLHIFNTFFYERLSKRGSDKLISYKDVTKWTTKAKLFEKEFIIIPIHHKAHWFVAIVYNLPAVLNKVQEAEGSTMSEDDGKPTIAAKPKLGNIVQPFNKETDCQIFVCDSLQKGHYNVLVRNLRDYFCAEARDKLNVDIDPRRISCRCASVPQQTNYCDCGVYLIHYVERFLNNPYECTILMLGKTPQSINGLNEYWKKERLKNKRVYLRRRLVARREEQIAEAGKPKEQKLQVEQTKEQTTLSSDQHSERRLTADSDESNFGSENDESAAQESNSLGSGTSKTLRTLGNRRSTLNGNTRDLDADHDGDIPMTDNSEENTPSSSRSNQPCDDDGSDDDSDDVELVSVEERSGSSRRPASRSRSRRSSTGVNTRSRSSVVRRSDANEPDDLYEDKSTEAHKTYSKKRRIQRLSGIPEPSNKVERRERHSTDGARALSSALEEQDVDPVPQTKGSRVQSARSRSSNSPRSQSPVPTSDVSRRTNGNSKIPSQLRRSDVIQSDVKNPGDGDASFDSYDDDYAKVIDSKRTSSRGRPRKKSSNFHS